VIEVGAERVWLRALGLAVKLTLFSLGGRQRLAAVVTVDAIAFAVPRETLG
jgi:hypothetical protein